MSDSPFQPSGNSVAVSTSTTSAAIGLPNASSVILVTNRSQSSAWVTWANGTVPTAAFPTPGNPTGTWGVEVAPMAQVTVTAAMQDMYVAAVLLTGNGVMTFTPGDGV
jgi:hypothetical protein